MAINHITMPTIGRPFQLGMLYDARNEMSVAGLVLWKKEEIETAVITTRHASTEYTVIQDDTLHLKATALDMGSALKLSFVSGLVQVSGSGRYLTDTKSSGKQSRLTLHYKETTAFSQVSWHHLGKANADLDYVIDKDCATHVVVGIEYGAEAFVIFDVLNVSKEKAKEIRACLQAELNNMFSKAHDDEAQNMPVLDEDLRKAVRCTFYGDFHLDEVPTTFEDTVELYHHLPKLLSQREQSAVPKVVHLCPLTALGDRASVMTRSVGDSVANRCVLLMESLDCSEVATLELSSAPVVRHFPWLMEGIRFVFRSLRSYRIMLQQTLKEIVPSIRSKTTEEGELEKFCENYQETVFETNRFDNWLQEKRTEIALLGTLVKTALREGVEICSDTATHTETVHRLDHDQVLSLRIYPAELGDPLVKRMRQVVEHPIKAADGAGDFWFKTKNTVKSLRTRFEHLLAFRRKSVGFANVACVVFISDTSTKNDKPAWLTFYQDGEEIAWNPETQPRTKLAQAYSNNVADAYTASTNVTEPALSVASLGTKIDAGERRGAPTVETRVASDSPVKSITSDGRLHKLAATRSTVSSGKVSRKLYVCLTCPGEEPRERLDLCEGYEGHRLIVIRDADAGDWKKWFDYKDGKRTGISDLTKAIVNEKRGRFKCDGCQLLIDGRLYTCLACKNYDLCRSCEREGRHPHHDMILHRPSVHTLDHTTSDADSDLEREEYPTTETKETPDEPGSESIDEVAAEQRQLASTSSLSKSGRMTPGRMLHHDESVYSEKHQMYLIMQKDGNLVLYRKSDNKALWATDTWGKPVKHCIMQKDGNLVLYGADGKPRWASNTNNNSGAYLTVHDDGYIAIYNTRGRGLFKGGAPLVSK